MIKFIKNLQFLFKPKFWILNNKYSEEWDVELNQSMLNNDFEKIDEYYTKLGDGENIWIKNHPYGSFIKGDPVLGERPSRLTLLKAQKKYRFDILSPQQKRAIKLKQIIK